MRGSAWRPSSWQAQLRGRPDGLPQAVHASGPVSAGVNGSRVACGAHAFHPALPSRGRVGYDELRRAGRPASAVGAPRAPPPPPLPPPALARAAAESPAGSPAEPAPVDAGPGAGPGAGAGPVAGPSLHPTTQQVYGRLMDQVRDGSAYRSKEVDSGAFSSLLLPPPAWGAETFCSAAAECVGPAGRELQSREARVAPTPPPAAPPVLPPPPALLPPPAGVGAVLAPSVLSLFHAAEAAAAAAGAAAGETRGSAPAAAPGGWAPSSTGGNRAGGEPAAALCRGPLAAGATGAAAGGGGFFDDFSAGTGAPHPKNFLSQSQGFAVGAGCGVPVPGEGPSRPPPTVPAPFALAGTKVVDADYWGEERLLAALLAQDARVAPERAPPALVRPHEAPKPLHEARGPLHAARGRLHEAHSNLEPAARFPPSFGPAEGGEGRGGSSAAPRVPEAAGVPAPNFQPPALPRPPPPPRLTALPRPPPPRPPPPPPTDFESPARIPASETAAAAAGSRGPSSGAGTGAGGAGPGVPQPAPAPRKAPAMPTGAREAASGPSAPGGSAAAPAPVAPWLPAVLAATAAPRRRGPVLREKERMYVARSMVGQAGFWDEGEGAGGAVRNPRRVVDGAAGAVGGDGLRNPFGGGATAGCASDGRAFYDTVLGAARAGDAAAAADAGSAAGNAVATVDGDAAASPPAEGGASLLLLHPRPASLAAFARFTADFNAARAFARDQKLRREANQLLDRLHAIAEEGGGEEESLPTSGAAYAPPTPNGPGRNAQLFPGVSPRRLAGEYRWRAAAAAAAAGAAGGPQSLRRLGGAGGLSASAARTVVAELLAWRFPSACAPAPAACVPGSGGGGSSPDCPPNAGVRRRSVLHRSAKEGTVGAATAPAATEEELAVWHDALAEVCAAVGGAADGAAGGVGGSAGGSAGAHLLATTGIFPTHSAGTASPPEVVFLKNSGGVSEGVCTAGEAVLGAGPGGVSTRISRGAELAPTPPPVYRSAFRLLLVCALPHGRRLFHRLLLSVPWAAGEFLAAVFCIGHVHELVAATLPAAARLDVLSWNAPRAPEPPFPQVVALLAVLVPALADQDRLDNDVSGHPKDACVRCALAGAGDLLLPRRAPPAPPAAHSPEHLRESELFMVLWSALRDVILAWKGGAGAG